MRASLNSEIPLKVLLSIMNIVSVSISKAVHLSVCSRAVWNYVSAQVGKDATMLLQISIFLRN